MLFDAHVHLAECLKKSEDAVFSLNASVKDYAGLTSVFSKEELLTTLSIKEKLSGQVLIAGGLHPLFPDLRNLAFIEEGLKEKTLFCTGEAGFDFFDDSERKNLSEQEKAFNEIVNLSQKYSVPVVLHLRKALDVIFKYAGGLKKLPCVLFHGFGGNLFEAESILKKGINAYFCIGKNLLKDSPKALELVRKLPEERLFFETDAPFMTLKNEEFTLPAQIKDVYEKAVFIKNTEAAFLEEKIADNFKKLLYF